MVSYSGPVIGEPVYAPDINYKTQLPMLQNPLKVRVILRDHVTSLTISGGFGPPGPPGTEELSDGHRGNANGPHQMAPSFRTQNLLCRFPKNPTKSI